MNINQRTKLTLVKGSWLFGFFKKIPESEAQAVLKLNADNLWEFFIIDPHNNLPQKATIVNGEDIESLEKIEI
jgi:hypothetical protein